MKAIQIEGTIKLFPVLPRDWKHYLNFAMADTVVLESEGFFDVVIPAYNTTTQELGEIYFDPELRVFTYPVLFRILPALAEAKAEKIAELKTAVRELYASIQWYVEMKRMEGEEVPLSVKEKIRQIKAKYDQLKAKINGFTTVIDVLSYPLPYATISQVREDLESIE